MSETMTSTKKVKQLVPQLRFGEFDNEWEQVRLGEICSTFKSGSSITSKNIFETGEFPVYGGNGRRGFSDTFTHEGFYFLIGRQGALCGNINRVNGKNFISEHAIAVQANEKSDTEWLAQRLDYMKLNRLSESSAQPGLAVNKLIRIKLRVPSKKEQQKIATFLSAVDKKIAQLTRKKALLEQYKKGVMQQLFSRQLRFKDEQGRAFPEWEEKKLGDVTKYTKGFAFKSKDYEKSGVRVVRVSDLGADKVKSENQMFIDSKKAAIYKKYELQKGNIIITTVGSKPEMLESAVGRGIFIHKNGEGLLNQNMLKFENIEGVNNRFIFGLLKSKRYQHFIKGIARGNANQANITVVDLLQYKIEIPSFAEQQKIANYLSVIDKKIDNVTNQITKSQAFKKGLLQQLFV